MSVDIDDDKLHVWLVRSRRTLESRQNMDDDKISMLEDELRKAKSVAVEAERNYEEVNDVWIFSAFLLLMSSLLITNT